MQQAHVWAECRIVTAATFPNPGAVNLAGKGLGFQPTAKLSR